MNGFIILDLHNVFCQVKNFDVSFQEILEMYPLDRVREIHISGGSWDTSEIIPSKQIRRDTHDDAVPEEVFDFLKTALTKCINAKYVVMEQLGTGLETEESRMQFQSDFWKWTELCRKQIIRTVTSQQMISCHCINWNLQHLYKIQIFMPNKCN